MVVNFETETNRLNSVMGEAIMRIKNGTYDKVNEELDNIRKKIYKVLNVVLPKYFQFEYKNHAKVIQHLSKLKKEYAKKNQIQQIDSNIYKLGLLLAIIYLILPSDVKLVYVGMTSRKMTALIKFLKSSLKSIVTLDVEAFFNTFVTLVTDLLKNIYEIMEASISVIGKALLLVLYILTTLLVMEMGCVVKIQFLSFIKVI